MGTLSDRKRMESFQKKGRKLNRNDILDYMSVMELKSRYFKLLYDQDKEKFLKDKNFKKFFKSPGCNWMDKISRTIMNRNDFNAFYCFSWDSSLEHEGVPKFPRGAYAFRV